MQQTIEKVGFSDIWYDEDGGTDTAKSGGMGLTSNEYYALKSKMLQSIKANGGFWIGKYEAGTTAIRDDGSGWLKQEMTLTEAYSQVNLYPYNEVTCSEAQTLASNMKKEGSTYTSSLMFGIQWDLVCKYIEQKGTKLGATVDERKAKIKTDSSTWGNYIGSEFNLNRGAISSEEGFYKNSWSFDGIEKKSGGGWVYTTTGAVDKNSVLRNI